MAKDVEPKKKQPEEPKKKKIKIKWHKTMCLLKLQKTAVTEQHAVMSKTYCAGEYSVKLAKYICIQKIKSGHAVSTAGG